MLQMARWHEAARAVESPPLTPGPILAGFQSRNLELLCQCQFPSVKYAPIVGHGPACDGYFSRVARYLCMFFTHLLAAGVWGLFGVILPRVNTRVPLLL